jgi:TetR/AcrR family transcriptional regulator
MNPENDTAQKILKAAKEVFSTLGYEGARIEEIAKKASVNKAMIYYHFKNKEELYHAVLDLFFQKNKVLQNIQEDASLGYREKLEKCIRYLADRVSENKKERCSIIAREMVSRGEVFFMMRDRYWIPEYKTIRSVIREGIEKGEFKQVNSVDFIVFTIFSHIIFYRINELTYFGSEIYSDLYPEHNKDKSLAYLFDLLNLLL